MSGTKPLLISIFKVFLEIVTVRVDFRESPCAEHSI